MREEKNKEGEVIVCRCMEVNKREIRAAIRLAASMGSISIKDQVKKLTSACMGLCQGRTCRQLIERMITEETGIKPSDQSPISIRPPIRPIILEALSKVRTWSKIEK